MCHPPTDWHKDKNMHTCNALTWIKRSTRLTTISRKDAAALTSRLLPKLCPCSCSLPEKYVELAAILLNSQYTHMFIACMLERADNVFHALAYDFLAFCKTKLTRSNVWPLRKGSRTTILFNMNVKAKGCSTTAAALTSPSSNTLWTRIEWQIHPTARQIPIIGLIKWCILVNLQNRHHKRIATRLDVIWQTLQYGYHNASKRSWLRFDVIWQAPQIVKHHNAFPDFALLWSGKLSKLSNITAHQNVPAVIWHDLKVYTTRASTRSWPRW